MREDNSFGTRSWLIQNPLHFLLLYLLWFHEIGYQWWVEDSKRDRVAILTRSSSLCFPPSSFFSLTVNGGYNHCNSISEKNNPMDMEMTNSVGPVCRQNLLIHSGNSLTRDHPLPCERLLHVSQLNLSRSDLRYCFPVLIAISAYNFSASYAFEYLSLSVVPLLQIVLFHWLGACCRYCISRSHFNLLSQRISRFARSQIERHYQSE